MSIIDLHIHSKYSLDGEYSCKEIINLCQKAGLKTTSITDHNSIEAIDESQHYAKKAGIQLIPGIEIDCVYNGINVHLLGYNIDYKARAFDDLYKAHYKQEVLVSRERIKKTNELGFNLSLDHVLDKTDNPIVTPEDIAEILLNSAEAYTNEILVPYLPGGYRSDNPNVNFYWDYFANGKPCYIDMHFPSIEEAIHMVINNGGIPILAHPGITFKNDYFQVDHLISLGVQGIEAFSSYHSIAESQYFYNIAKEKGLFVTAGSDFHGKNKPSVKLGKTNCFLGDKELLLEINSILN